ncbi:MAG: penicillin acylase family protein [Gammaproteobacteria bacterium]|nr:penicillin acylase family protein [Gammaproteobacteria bacterium]
MKKWIIRGSAALLIFVTLIVGAAWWVLRGSLPALDGEVAAVAISPKADVRIERDADGVVTIVGNDVFDVAYAIGFAHGQDRFFQMDLSRRLAAGELAALVGRGLVAQDELARIFRLRLVARQVIADATPTERNWLDAYTRGVNAGLGSLSVRPWEYFILRATPEVWRAEDSVLVVHSMWWSLQYKSLVDEVARRDISARTEERVETATRGEADVRPAGEVTRFLFPRGDEWDTPNFQTLAEEAAANGGEAYRAPEVPPPELLDLRSARVAQMPLSEEREIPGSNAWAVSGRYAAGGGALVAGDMHLGLRVPTNWYRARLQIARDSLGRTRELNGVTLPGLPAVVAGSNGEIAWSFTNSFGDWNDVKPVACEPTRNVYFTAEGERRFEIQRETITVAGSDPVELEVRQSPLGVVMRTDAPRKQASGATHICWLARWLVTERGATTLASFELQQVSDVASALELAPRMGIPHQNFIIGDRSGRIAWTIIGRIPRGNLGPETPRPIAWRSVGDTPVIADPEVGRLWSANARHVEGPFEESLGNDEADGGMHYDKGVRQRQIRNRLLAINHPATPADMLSIQLDDRALLIDRWQRLLLATLDNDAVRNQPTRAELRRLVIDWTGRAAVDSVSYRLVRDFREKTRSAVWSMITEAIGAGQGSTAFPLFEGSLWRLVTEQPPHLLSANYKDWHVLLLAQADAVIRSAEESCGTLATCTWGLRNISRIRHPLSPSLGPLGRYLDMPARVLAGDTNSPRVAGPTFGASERFAVSPGREVEAYMQLPGGASGHPLSPFYLAGFDDWAEGRMRPLLPGPAMHTLTLKAVKPTGAALRTSG